MSNFDPMTRGPAEVVHDLNYIRCLEEFTNNFAVDPQLVSALSLQAGELYATSPLFGDGGFKHYYQLAKITSLNTITEAYEHIYGNDRPATSWWSKVPADNVAVHETTKYAQLRMRAMSQQHPVLATLERVNKRDLSGILKFTDSNETNEQDLAAPRIFKQLTGVPLGLTLEQRPVPAKFTTEQLIKRRTHFVDSSQLAVTDIILGDLSVLMAGSPTMRDEANKLAEEFRPYLFVHNSLHKYAMLDKLSVSIASLGEAIPHRPAEAGLLAAMYDAEFYFKIGLIISMQAYTEACGDNDVTAIPDIFPKKNTHSPNKPANIGATTLSQTVSIEVPSPIEAVVDVDNKNIGQASILTRQEAAAETAADLAALTADMQRFNKDWKISKSDASRDDAKELTSALVNGELAIYGNSHVTKTNALRVRDVLLVLDKHLSQPNNSSAVNTINTVLTALKQQALLESRSHALATAAEVPVEKLLDTVAPIRQLLEWMCSEKDTVCSFIWKRWSGGRKYRFETFFTSLEEAIHETPQS